MKKKNQLLNHNFKIKQVRKENKDKVKNKKIKQELNPLILKNI